MEYTVCAAVKGYVYSTIEADSMEEAWKIANKDTELDWDSEEWISLPEPVSIRNNETQEYHIFNTGHWNK